MTSDDRRGQIKVNVRASEKALFDHLARDLKMSKIDLATEIVGWFLRQREPVQRAIAGMYGKDTPRMLEEILNTLKAEWQAQTADEEMPGPDDSGDDDSPPNRGRGKKGRK